MLRVRSGVVIGSSIAACLDDLRDFPLERRLGGESTFKEGQPVCACDYLENRAGHYARLS